MDVEMHKVVSTSSERLASSENPVDAVSGAATSKVEDD